MAGDSQDKRLSRPAAAPCPAGAFAELAVRLRKRRQRRAFLRFVTAAFPGVAIASGTFIWLATRAAKPPADMGNMNFAGISCSEVQRLGQAYMKRELAEPVREQVRQHVAQCPRCGPLFKSMGTMKG